jgi:hypothetical protein
MTKQYEFTYKAAGKHWAIAIDPVADYGYFETVSGIEGGGLWFEGKSLTDYDGRGVLPREVCELVAGAGYEVGEAFYP